MTELEAFKRKLEAVTAAFDMAVGSYEASKRVTEAAKAEMDLRELEVEFVKGYVREAEKNLSKHESDSVRSAVIEIPLNAVKPGRQKSTRSLIADYLESHEGEFEVDDVFESISPLQDKPNRPPIYTELSKYKKAGKLTSTGKGSYIKVPGARFTK